MMHIYLTFDHEIFFGNPTGTPENCMLRPVDHLLGIFDETAIRATFFTDAGYLLALQRESKRHPHLRASYDAIVRQLQQLCQKGHTLELHIHAHWEDSSYQGDRWILPMDHYRLQSYSKGEIRRIVHQYADFLGNISGRKPVAFRAGGWCIQPFQPIADPLYEYGIRVDSTVFYGGYNQSATHFFDFRNAPKLDIWRFDEDPLKTAPEGRFIELPIASIPVSPLFYWKFALTKLLPSVVFKPMGDGRSLPAGKKQLLRMLTTRGYMAASTDGFKAGLLFSGYRHWKKSGFNHYTLIGHPKALSIYALRRLKEFIARVKGEAQFNVVGEVLDYSKERKP